MSANSIANNVSVGADTTLNINDDVSIAGTLTKTTTGIIGNTAGTPTVTLTGTGALGGGSGAITFYNLTTSGTGTHTFTGSGTNISKDHQCSSPPLPAIIHIRTVSACAYGVQAVSAYNILHSQVFFACRDPDL